MSRYPAIVLITVAVLLPTLSAADPLPVYYWFSEIRSMQQYGQNNYINIHSHVTSKKAPDDTSDDSGDDTDWWDDDWTDDDYVNAGRLSLRLWRISGTENKKIMEDSALLFDDGYIIPSEACQEGETDADCALHPAECDDCNGDGILECKKFYCTLYEYYFNDLCVPPGEAWYRLSDWVDGCLDRKGMIMEDWGDCGAWSTVAPEDDPCSGGIDDDVLDDADDGGDDSVVVVVVVVDDDETDDDGEDVDDDDDDGSCGGCSVGGTHEPASLFAGMLVIGLAALIAGRKK